MIVVVDDDVWFAEEIQDLLHLNGHQLVVVVTHPHDSSLHLLDHASLLILDLSLAATTALHVLEEVRQRGNSPPVVMVSGGGDDMLEAARAIAVARGFPVLGALPKVAVATELLKLLSAQTPAAARMSAAIRLPPRQSAVPDEVGFSRIFASGSLEYVGARMQPGLQRDAAPDLPPHPLRLLADHDLQDPERIIGSALVAQRLLALNGHSGLLVVQLPEAAFLDPETRLRICAGYGYSQAALSHIVFDLGPDVSGQALRHVRAMTDLRLAGYGLLLRCSDDALPPVEELTELPITIFAVDAPLARVGADLRDIMQTLRTRMIGSLCSCLHSNDDLERIRNLGFTLVGVATEPPFIQEH
jgi:CheY-like chemotaxis protein